VNRSQQARQIVRAQVGTGRRSFWVHSHSPIVSRARNGDVNEPPVPLPGRSQAASRHSR
jgi:hypothetical protein